MTTIDPDRPDRPNEIERKDTEKTTETETETTTEETETNGDDDDETTPPGP
jgi:hypothetical protein